MGEPDRRADRWLARESEQPQIAVIGLPWSPRSKGLALSALLVRDRLNRFGTYQVDRQADLSGVRVRDEGNWPVTGLDQTGLVEYLASRIEALPTLPLSLFLGGDDGVTDALVTATGSSLLRFSSSIHSSGGEAVTIGAHGFGLTTANHGSYATVDRIAEEGMADIVDEALGVPAASERIHVSVDLDTLDPAFASACREARPGGLDTPTLAEGVRLCARSQRVSSMDFVGVDADLDDEGRTLDVMAYLFLCAVVGFKERSQAL